MHRKSKFTHQCASLLIFKFRFYIVATLVVLSLVYVFLIREPSKSKRSFHKLGPCKTSKNVSIDGRDDRKMLINHKTTVRLAAAICGNRLNEAMTMLKSAILFAKGVELIVEIFQDEVTAPLLLNKLDELKEMASGFGVSFDYRLHDSWFPTGHEKQWRNLYAPCSAQRLFFPLILPDVDAVVYVDTDILLFSSLKDIWDHFDLMNEDQAFGMALDDEPTVPFGYHTVPFYDRGGLNAGVIMMNLTRLRKMELENEVLLIMDGYEESISGGQDVINIYLHYHPCHVYELSCAFNYGFEHCLCIYGGDCRCKTADASGFSILHGRAHTFFVTNAIDRTLFSIDIYNEFLKAEINEESGRKLIENLQTKFSSDSYEGCFKLDTHHRMLDKATEYFDL